MMTVNVMTVAYRIFVWRAQSRDAVTLVWQPLQSSAIDDDSICHCRYFHRLAYAWHHCRSPNGDDFSCSRVVNYRRIIDANRLCSVCNRADNWAYCIWYIRRDALGSSNVWCVIWLYCFVYVIDSNVFFVWLYSRVHSLRRWFGEWEIQFRFEYIE